MLTIRPPPAARMCGSTSREQRISEKSLTSRSAAQFSSESVSNVPGWAPPALLTRQSIPPSASAVRATRSRTCSSLREQIATRAPSATSSRAIASPMPFEPPVTSARRPSRPSFTSSVGRRPTRRASPAAAGRRCRRRASSRAPRPCGAARTGGGGPHRRRPRRRPTRPPRARSGACPRGCRSAARSRASAAERCSPARGTPARASSARSRSAAATGPPSAAPSPGRPTDSGSRGARSQERPEPFDPLVDPLLVDEAERESERVPATPVREEQRPRNGRDALVDGAPREVDRVHARQCQPGEEAALRRRPTCVLGQGALERRQHPLALATVERPRARQLLLDPAAPGRLLEEPLTERAGALVGQLLRVHEPRRDLGGPDRPAEADTGAERLRGGARLDDDVRAEAPEARQRVLGEAELAVGDVLDDEEAVVARKLDEGRAALGGQADAGRVLVIRNRVEELRPHPALQLPLELVHVQPVR